MQKKVQVSGEGLRKFGLSSSWTVIRDSTVGYMELQVGMDDYLKLIDSFYSTKATRSAWCAERKRSETRTIRVGCVPVSTTPSVWRSVANVDLPI